jgi:AcrR family transcriptional regulator
MGRPALDEQAIAAFRDRLCAVALDQFAELGYRAVSLRGIAREMGVSHALAYRYFEDKDEVFAAVRQLCLERFVAFQEARLAAIDDPIAAIRAGARSYLEFARLEPHAFRVLFDLEQPPPGEVPALRAAHRRAFRVLERVIARAIDSGQLGRGVDAGALAEAMADTILAGSKP